MKKTIFYVIFILGISAIFASCVSDKFTVKDDGGWSYSSGIFALGSGSYKLTIDEDLPIEKCAVITFTTGPSFIVREWNGIDIKEKIYGKKQPSNKDETILTVPAGSQKITFDVAYVSGNTINSLKDFIISYKFEQGKKYKFIVEYKSLGFLKGGEFIMKLLDDSTEINEWNLSEIMKKK